MYFFGYSFTLLLIFILVNELWYPTNSCHKHPSVVVCSPSVMPACFARVLYLLAFITRLIACHLPCVLPYLILLGVFSICISVWVWSPPLGGLLCWSASTSYPFFPCGAISVAASRWATLSPVSRGVFAPIWTCRLAGLGMICLHCDIISPTVFVSNLHFVPSAQYAVCDGAVDTFWISSLFRMVSIYLPPLLYKNYEVLGCVLLFYMCLGYVLN